MVDRTAEDIIQDRRIEALELFVRECDEQIKALNGALRNVHVRIDRLPTPAMPEPLNFWTFLLRLLRK